MPIGPNTATVLYAPDLTSKPKINTFGFGPVARVSPYYVAVAARGLMSSPQLRAGAGPRPCFSFQFGLLSPLSTWCSSFSWESHFYYMNKSPPLSFQNPDTKG